VDDPRLLPQAAIVDPLLIRSAPKPVAAAAALDALAHCVESLWACRSTSESKQIASGALNEVVANVEAAVLHGSGDAQEVLAYSASSAGSAIAITRTTAAHALSYYLTSQYGIRHGHAVALTLGAFIKANGSLDQSTVSDTRGVQHVRQAVDVVCQALHISAALEGPAAIAQLIEKLGLSSSVDEAAGRRVDRELWVQSVNPERLANNPRRMDNAALFELVNSV
jgi:alcohol dehydrogenase